MSALSRRKGAVYEREVASKFRDAGFGDDCRRGLGQARTGADVADVEVPHLWVQTKHGARPDPINALHQAMTDMGNRDLWPVAVCRRNRGVDTVTLTLTDFLVIFKAWTEKQ